MERKKRRGEPTVGELMQAEVVSLDASATLDVADRLMRSQRIRHLPIVADGRLVGVLSQRDVLRAGIDTIRPHQPASELEWLARIPIGEAMAREVFTTRPTSTLASAAEMMLARDVGCLPVLENDRVVGLLTRTDCLRYLVELLESASERRSPAGSGGPAATKSRIAT